EQNYPNPFNPSTTIEYSIINNSLKASLFIYDCKGNLVRKILENKFHKLGDYSVKWNGNNENRQGVAGGIYFLKLFTDEEVIVKQAILVK
ncbi:MAG: T9SS type A sorting domain-containing protein, partial [Candidatus Delongbacteria bacterium]|nr:T9SS type A sorting domain-containing protein [Candidatus Delongbacteria bacterium]